MYIFCKKDVKGRRGAPGISKEEGAQNLEPLLLLNPNYSLVAGG
jgi:hypothetical protein